jgi:hypothetical protein
MYVGWVWVDIGKKKKKKKENPTRSIIFLEFFGGKMFSATRVVYSSKFSQF